MKSTKTRGRAAAVLAAAGLSLLLGVGSAAAAGMPDSSQSGHRSGALADLVDDEGSHGGVADRMSEVMGSQSGGEAPQSGGDVVAVEVQELFAPFAGTAESSGVVGMYSDPDHVDVTYVTDEETGEVFEVRSGVTHWEEVDPSAPVPFEVAAATTASDIFKATFTPNTGNLATDGRPRMRVEIDVPADAKEGDEYQIDFNLPWKGPSLKNLEVKDGNGKVFAIVTDVRQPDVPGWAGPSSANLSTKIVFTEEVEAHAEIIGFFEGEIDVRQSGKVWSNNITATVDGVKIGESGKWTTKASVMNHASLALRSNVYSATGGPYVQATVRPFYSEVPTNVRLTYTGWPSSFTPSCKLSNYTMSFQPPAPGDQWYVTSAVNVVDADVCTDTKVEFTFTKAEMTSWFADRGYTLKSGDLIYFDTNFYGPAETPATITVSGQAGIGLGTVSGVTGKPPAAGAEHLALLTSKSSDVPSGEKVKIGDTITYTIETTPADHNARPITNVFTVDELPKEVEFVSANNGGVYNSSSHVVEWGPRILSSTGKFTDTIQVKVVSAPESGQIKNFVFTAAEEVCIEGDDQSVCDDEEITEVAGDPAFDFVKSSTIEDTNGNGYLGDEGDTILYTFTVTNTGDLPITTAKLTDNLLGVSDLECITNPPLEPGASTTCPDPGDGKFSHVITAADVDAGKVVNQATMCIDPELGLDCEVGETEEPTLGKGFTFEKFSSVTQSEENKANGIEGNYVGDTINYWFEFTNTGDVALTDATITDDLLNLNNEPCAPAGQTINPGQTVVCENTYEYVITAADAAKGEVVNHAVGKIPGLPDDPDEETTPIVNPGFEFNKLVVEIQDATGKEVTGGKVVVGDKIHFGFTATNTGDVDIHTLTVTDPKLGVKDSSCLAEDQILKVGETLTCVDSPDYWYTVTAADEKAGVVHNVATGSVPGLPDDEGETETPVKPTVTPGELPKTGAGGTWLLVASGSALAAAGAYTVVRVRRPRVTA